MVVLIFINSHAFIVFWTQNGRIALEKKDQPDTEQTGFLNKLLIFVEVVINLTYTPVKIDNRGNILV